MSGSEINDALREKARRKGWTVTETLPARNRTMNDLIRGRPTPMDPMGESDARIAAIERQIADNRVAVAISEGVPEGIARMLHGPDKTVADYGGGPRGSAPRAGPNMNDVIRGTVRAMRGG